jgi:hypothetical protein
MLPIERETGDLLAIELGDRGIGVAWELGKLQMQHFFQENPEPLMPGIMIGGEVVRVAKLPVVHAYDYAQMTGTWLGVMESAFFRGQRLSATCLQNEKIEIRLSHQDFIWYRSLILGEVDACVEYPFGRESGRAKKHLETLLQGERYRKW